MEWLFEPQALIALATLTVLEIVLGIDNIIFISILADKLPAHQQARARVVGLGLAMFMRIALLFSLAWLMQLTTPLFTVLEEEVSTRDLILIVGGLFLLAKGTLEIHDKLEGEEAHGATRPVASFAGVIFQILLLDIVFSLDSVITAIGMADQLWVMVAAVVIAVIFMMFTAGGVSRFINKHPTIKILALSFLLLVGLALVGEGMGFHIPKGYIYFAMAFSVFVEMLNLRIRKPAARPVQLHQSYVRPPDARSDEGKGG